MSAASRVAEEIVPKGRREREVPETDEAPRAGADWAPNSEPQRKFLASTAYEVLYGGAAGGGKSAALVMIPLRWCGHPHFKALVLRRETQQLEELINYSNQWYRVAYPEARPKQIGNGLLWQFPSGATVRFSHCRDEADAFNYQGKEYQVFAPDELTHFTFTQYAEIKSRVRSSKEGLPRIIRATSNPGGVGHAWVFKRWGAWLDPEFEAPGLLPRIDKETGRRMPPLAPGQVAHIALDASGGEVYVPKGTPDSLSRTFIAAFATDNVDLMRNDPEYLRRLQELDPVRREQLLRGDWLAHPAAGKYFKRAWWKTADVSPAQAVRVRYWDRASTEKGGDWTVGLRLAVTRDGSYFVEDVVRIQGGPREVQLTIKNTALMDSRRFGRALPVVLEQDPGQAGVFEAFVYSRLLAGFNVRFVRVSKDKVTRAQPVSAQVEAGNVTLITKTASGAEARWVEPFLSELEEFPEGSHDDQVDALSGAFAALHGQAVRRRSLPEGHIA